MSKIQEVGRLFVVFVIVVAFAAMVWFLVDGFGAWDVYKAQIAARAAEAEAQRLTAQADLLANRRELWATGALVFASVKDSLLVTFAFILNALLLAGVVAALVWTYTRERGEPGEVENGQ